MMLCLLLFCNICVWTQTSSSLWMSGHDGYCWLSPWLDRGRMRLRMYTSRWAYGVISTWGTAVEEGMDHPGCGCQRLRRNKEGESQPGRTRKLHSSWGSFSTAASIICSSVSPATLQQCNSPHTNICTYPIASVPLGALMSMLILVRTLSIFISKYT